MSNLQALIICIFAVTGKVSNTQFAIKFNLIVKKIHFYVANNFYKIKILFFFVH